MNTLDAMQLLQFKKFVSDQSGMNLQEVENHLAKLDDAQKQELIKNFQNHEKNKSSRTNNNSAEINQVTCPKCKSKQIHADKKGFSGKKACCGAILAGPFGLLCGTHKSNKIKLTCLNCKYSW